MASWRRPCAIWISARTMAPPMAGEMYPASRTFSMPSAVIRRAVVEIPTRPCGQPQRRGCPTEHQIVVLRCEIEHPSSVFHGLGHIAPAPEPARHGSGRSYPADGEIPLRPRRPSPPPGIPVARADQPAIRRVQPPFGIPQPGLNALSSRRKTMRQAYSVLSTGLTRTSSSGSAFSQPSSVANWRLRFMARHDQLDQVRGSLEIPGRQRVADRIVRRTIVLVPLARAPVQATYLVRLLAPSSACEEHRQRDGDSDTSVARHPAETIKRLARSRYSKVLPAVCLTGTCGIVPRRHHKASHSADRGWRSAVGRSGQVRTGFAKLLRPDSPRRNGGLR